MPSRSCTKAGKQTWELNEIGRRRGRRSKFRRSQTRSSSNSGTLERCAWRNYRVATATNKIILTNMATSVLHKTGEITNLPRRKCFRRLRLMCLTRSATRCWQPTQVFHHKTALHCALPEVGVRAAACCTETCKRRGEHRKIMPS